jgi:hypothetical protein
MRLGSHTLLRLALSLAVAGVLLVFSVSPVLAVTQAEYTSELAARIGLGQGLTCEQAIIMLEAVGIVPEGGWHCRHDVTCELVAEVQILTIKSAQMGLIWYTPEDTVIIVSALSDELDCCPPPRIVEILPPATTPPPPITTEIRGGGIGSGEQQDPVVSPSS